MNKYIKELIIALVFIAGVAIFYGNTLKNGFIHDDHGQVDENTYIHSLQYLPKVLTGCIWESAVGSCKTTYYYRPLQSLSYLLTYQISAKPWVFHLMNLIYYTISIFLVFILIKLLTKNTLIAFLAGFIFLVHPLNNEVVNWIATVPELLYTIFTLLATICYFQYRKQQNPQYLTPVYLFYTLGIFSKEPAVFVPFIFMALDLIFFKLKLKSLLSWKNMKPYLIFILIFLVYMGLRFWVLGGLGQDPSSKMTLFQHIWTFFDLFASYIKKVIWPYPLNLFYTFHPTYQLWNFHFITDIFITLGFVGICLIAWKSKRFLAFFSLIWFFVFLSPSLLFVNSIGENLFAERHVFASTIGFSVIIAVLLNWLWQKKGFTFSVIARRESPTDAAIFPDHRRFPRSLRSLGMTITQLLVVGLISIVFLLSLAITYPRNMLWQNDNLIYADTLQKSPDADLIHYNLAKLYETDGKTDLAKEQYGEIVKRGTWIGLYKTYNNLGNISRVEKKYDEAINYFEASVKNNPQHRNAYNNLGALSLERGDLLKSVTSLCKALLIDPNYKEANNNFNAAASQIQGLDNKSFISLYEQMLRGNIFKPDSSSKTPQNDKKGTIIQLKTKDCSLPQGCLLIFSSNLPKNEFLFPFLTVGKTKSNEVVRSRYFEFNPETSEIALGIDHQFEGSNIHFWFPTCDGIYYEAEIPAQK